MPAQPETSQSRAGYSRAGYSGAGYSSAIQPSAIQSSAGYSSAIQPSVVLSGVVQSDAVQITPKLFACNNPLLVRESPNFIKGEFKTSLLMEMDAELRQPFNFFYQNGTYAPDVVLNKDHFTFVKCRIVRYMEILHPDGTAEQICIKNLDKKIKRRIKKILTLFGFTH